ncbi:MAG: PP2C family protein-serine/threonine phosphatase [Pyrinomonadaceae bacterium]|nr:PP2C family protein-serine/threonine phosphatase [Phycisphaerales bacterium]
MNSSPHTWQEELAIIDDVLKSISGVSDPEELVPIWNGIDKLIPLKDYVSVSRRGEAPPHYLVTRSSRFVEHLNPWTQRERLPRLSGGLLGEIAYADKPVIINDLASRLKADDPSWFYLQGYQALVALPSYEDGKGINTTIMLIAPDEVLDPTKIPILHWQAGLFGRGTRNQVLRNELATAHAAMDREMQTVAEIQRSLLPPKLPTIAEADFASSYIPCTRAGGDYYDFLPLEDGRWGILIADVSGHGSPAAVLMAMMWAVLHAHPVVHPSPGALLRYLNAESLRSYTRGGDFITAFYMVYDPAARRLTYACAGHNPPRLLRRGQVVALDADGGPPLGVIADVPYTQTTLDLEHGDLLLLYTDGITEAMAPALDSGFRAMFGVERVDELLQTCRDCDARDCVNRIAEAVAAFIGGQPILDDQTLIVMRCR